MAKLKKTLDTRDETPVTAEEIEQYPGQDLPDPPKAPVHLAHSLKLDLILLKIKALLAHDPPTGGPSPHGAQGVYTQTPKEPVNDPLVERRGRLVAALAGATPEQVCSNHVEYYPQLEAAVDVIAEAWGGGVPPYLYK